MHDGRTRATIDLPMHKESPLINRLTALREARQLTMEEVAAIMGLTIGTISRHENGKTKLSQEQVEKYAKLYRVGSFELYVDPKDALENGQPE